jgi:transposase
VTGPDRAAWKALGSASVLASPFLSELRTDSVLVFLMPERLIERRVAGSHAQARDTKTMSGSSVMVGIDVASAHVDVAVIGAELPATLARVNNDADGHSGLAAGHALDR